VPPGDSGIHKPFDRIVKSFAEEAPRLLLQLTRLLPAGEERRLRPLPTETAPEAKQPDFVGMASTAKGGRKVIHAEFVSVYHRRMLAKMARYGGSLAWQYRAPVLSALVLLRRDGVPKVVPEIGHYDIGETRTSHKFKVVRMWELDPTPVLETKNPRLLPWALLMKSTDEEVRKIASMVVKRGDDEAKTRFLILGKVRYDRNTLEDMLDEPRGLARAILEASGLLQEWEEARKKGVKQGRRKGRQEGRKEGHHEGREEGQSAGRTEEARRMLRTGLRAKFPGLETMQEIDLIASPETLEQLMEQVVLSTDRSAVHHAILAAAGRPN
jgi:hypothetical protein